MIVFLCLYSPMALSPLYSLSISRHKTHTTTHRSSLGLFCLAARYERRGVRAWENMGKEDEERSEGEQRNKNQNKKTKERTTRKPTKRPTIKPRNTKTKKQEPENRNLIMCLYSQKINPGLVVIYLLGVQRH